MNANDVNTNTSIRRHEESNSWLCFSGKTFMGRIGRTDEGYFYAMLTARVNGKNRGSSEEAVADLISYKRREKERFDRMQALQMQSLGLTAPGSVKVVSNNHKPLPVDKVRGAHETYGKPVPTDETNTWMLKGRPDAEKVGAISID